MISRHIIIFNISLLQVDFCDGGRPEHEYLRNHREEEDVYEDNIDEYGNKFAISKDVTIRVNLDKQQACGASDDSGVGAETGTFNIAT